MSDYQEVRKEAKKRGPITMGGTTPIPIQPTSEYVVTRLITIPVREKDGNKVVGLYMRHPAFITVVAWSSAEASARANEIQYNAMAQAWGQGLTPWDGEGKRDWQEVDLPQFTKPYELR